jgi:hypothetical protein
MVIKYDIAYEYGFLEYQARYGQGEAREEARKVLRTLGSQ